MSEHDLIVAGPTEARPTYVVRAAPFDALLAERDRCREMLWSAVEGRIGPYSSLPRDVLEQRLRQTDEALLGALQALSVVPSEVER